VTIRDRPGLEAASCECYANIRRETDRLLGDSTAIPAEQARTHAEPAGIRPAQP
jgi:hypothetical protein